MIACLYIKQVHYHPADTHFTSVERWGSFLSHINGDLIQFNVIYTAPNHNNSHLKVLYIVR